jgi:tripartite-type tricarboxylate transporter receptor subunit TctC
MVTRALIACGVALIAGALPSGNAAAAAFYQGKTVTMVINYPAGGPTDIEGRIIARHLSNHIAGKPRIIVKNMGGGGGMIGTNYLGEVAKPDGLTFGFFTWNVIAGMLGDPGLRVKYTDFGLVAGVQNPIVFYMRTDTPPGIKVPTDIMKTNGFKALSLDLQNANTLQQTLALDVLGVKYTAVPGYRGLKDVETAILQNEGQFANTSLPGWTASIAPTMAKQGVVVGLWHMIAPGPDGVVRRSPALPDMPTFDEFYETVHGKKPSGVAYESLRLMTDIITSMFRTTFTPAHTPDEALRALRAGFVSMWKDKAFITDYSKAVKSTPLMVAGEEGEKIIAQLKTAKPEIKSFITAYMKKLGAK